MEIKIDPVMPPGTGEGLLGETRDSKDHSLFKPVEKVEQDNSRELKKEDELVREHSGHPDGQMDRQALDELVEETQDVLDGLPSPVDLNFKVDDKTGDVIVSVMNKDTEEIIRQIPPEEMVKVRQRMVELRGVLYNQKA